MCGPAAMGYAALGTQAIGAVTSAAAASASASVQKMGLNLDATLSGINAQRDQDVSRMIIGNGYQEQVNERAQIGQVKGAQIAAMGANNVDMTTGSALNRLTSTDYVGERNVQQIRLNAARTAVGYRADALNQEMRVGMDKAGASSINPLLTGASSLVGSAGNLASSWYTMSRIGMLGGGSNTLTGGGNMLSGGYSFSPNPASTMNWDAAGAMRYGTLR